MNTFEIPPCPRAGEGVNRWLYLAALKLRRLGKDDSEINSALRSQSTSCGRVVKQSEIQRAVTNSAKRIQERLNFRATQQAKWPELNRARLDSILSLGLSKSHWKKISPVEIRANDNLSDRVIAQFFKEGELLCCGKSRTNFQTKPLEFWLGKLANLQLIVPSPMSKEFGYTLDGKLSQRTLDNTGARRFLIIECDRGTLDDQTCILWHLGTIAPLALVVYSGGKSLHGWFYCANRSETDLRQFMSYAVSLGADPATWTRCQFVRMPDGLRDSGKRQKLLFYAPSILEVTP